MPSAVISAEDQNRSLLVREREGREAEEEGGEEEGERSLSWLLLRRKQKRFGVGGAEMERMEKRTKKIMKQQTIKKESNQVKTEVIKLM